MDLPAAFTKHQSKQSDQRDWYALATNAKKKHLDIYLYGVIGGWRCNVNNFDSDIKAAGDVQTITVYLNTVGGTFYDGLAINNTLKQHKAFVTIKVMGYALSMGSYLLTGADHVECASNALIMAHRAQGGVQGDAARMQHVAAILEKHESASLIPDYMRVLNKSEDEVKAILQKETWWTATEAKAAGLVNTITGEVDLDEAEKTLSDNAWDYAAEYFQNPIPDFSSRFDLHLKNQQSQNTPLMQRLLNKITGSSALPDKHETEDDMTPEQITALGASLAAAVAEANKPVLDAINNIGKAPEKTDIELLQEKLDAANAAKDAAEAKLKDAAPPASGSDDVSPEIQALQAKLAAAEARVVELSKPDPSKNTPPVDNTGPADADGDDWDQATNHY